jgi:hypothetical protein
MSKRSLNRDDLTIEVLDQVLDALGYDENAQVRTVRRDDGREVLLLQMNRFSLVRLYVTGRPDGKRIKGHDSFYEWVLARIEDYKKEKGSDVGFYMDTKEWQALFSESADRYVRYLLFSGIQRWKDVERDTRTNMHVADLARRYADDEVAWGIYQYKGYMLMMNTIARAELALAEKDPHAAITILAEGLEKIGTYCRECLLNGHPDAEAVTREHYLANLLKYRDELIHDGRLPDAAREDPRNVV